jgi:hypothetical protein
MSLLLQHLLVLTLAGACAAYAIWGAYQTLFGKRNVLGKCCAKGCAVTPEPNKPQATQRVVFLPVEMLRKSK